MSCRDVAIAIALGVLTFGEARAQPTPTPPQTAPLAGAELLYQEGLTAYRARRYQEALTKFQASFDLKPAASKVLIDIGQAYLRLGNGREALFFFNYYLRDALRIPPTVRADVERYIDEAKALQAEKQSAPAPRRAEPERRVDGPRADPAPSQSQPTDKEDQPPQTGRTFVAFTAQDRTTRYDLSIAGQRCITPCRMQLESGAVRLRVLHPQPFATTLSMRPGAFMARINHRRAERVVAGGLFLPLGVVMGVGSALTLYYGCKPADNVRFEGGCANISLGYGLGIPLALVGGGLVIGGIVTLATAGSNGAEVTRLSVNGDD